MQISFQGSSPVKVIFYHEDSKKIPELVKNGFFSGKEDEIFFSMIKDQSLILVGLGKENKSTSFKLLKTGILLVRNSLKKIKIPSVMIDFSGLDKGCVFFLMQGIHLEAFYEYSLKKKDQDLRLNKLIVVYENRELINKANIIASCRNTVRELVDTPSNILTTTSFVEKIIEIFNDIPAHIDIWDLEKLREEKLEGLISVGKGSVHPPYLVKIHYKPEDVVKKITLVGKGIVFDSGGYSLKTTENMLDMKGDMAGAATVLGVMLAIHKLSLPIEVYGLLPLAENALSGNSYKVSDVIRFKNNKSVEIVNTDAEGRLVLADALTLTGELEPELIIDIATLTGACMVALGTDIYGILSNNESLAAQYKDYVNQNTSEKVWELPLYERYKEQMKSEIADIKNTGKKWGGAITAALFLKEFVPDNKDWIHLDIAGPFYDDGIGLFESRATGIPLESLVLYLNHLVE